MSSSEEMMIDTGGVGGAPQHPASISIQSWMEAVRDLSPSSFAERAVDLAWTLTKHLCHIIDNSAVGAQLPLEDHISADNVIIFTTPPSNDNPRSNDSDVTITDAKFRSLVPIEPAHVEGSAQPEALAALSNLRPSSPDACVALGKLFLDIFSKFTTSSAGMTGTALAGDGRSNGRTHEDRGDSTATEPARKRQATTSTDTFNAPSQSERARDLLISSGQPLSVCRLISDLLDAGEGEPVEAYSPMLLDEMLGAEHDARPRRFAIRSIQEALSDLSQMKMSPTKFLFDQKCPQKTLDDICLVTTDVQLIGREEEMSVLNTSKNNISDHVRAMGNRYANLLVQGKFLCESFFLSGYAGCGKSSLVHSLTHSCSKDQWFILCCKFSQQSSPHMILSEAFNGFFGKWGEANSNPNSDLPSEMIQSFNKICTSIFNLMDDEALSHLCYFVPNFAKVFPLIDLRSNSHNGNNGVSPMDTAGSGRKRVRNLLHVLLKAICSGGHPVLFTLDDLQWSESYIIDDLSDFILRYIHNTVVNVDACRRGLLVVGAFRSNEVGREFTTKISSLVKARETNATLISIDDFSKDDATELISLKLCMPRRYVRELGDMVHDKTRGNVFFVLEFLRSIIRNKTLTFSMRYCQWIWDCDVVDMQMISDDVAQLLTTTFDQLPSNLQETLKVLSCLGFQVEVATVEALDSGNDVLSFNMREWLPPAVKEGILEKAGPVYQFTHDIIYQTVYDLIPMQSRELLHKTIGRKLIKTCSENSSRHTLAADQINIFCKSGIPVDINECLFFAQINAKAGKIAIAASSYDQACTYLDMGIELLDARHWQTQYSLSLNLFEMSASVSWARGELPKMAQRLAAILSNAKEFDDTLMASSLAVMLLMASSKHNEAIKKCCRVLDKLGETLPAEYDTPYVLSELSSLNESLVYITASQMKQLPLMTDKKKLNSMKFFNLLCMCAFHANPMLLHIVSCRMVKLTMQHGFCDDSIAGLAAIGFTIFHSTDNFELASRVVKVTESLIEQSPNKHQLQSRLTMELYAGVKCLTEPAASAMQLLPDMRDSAMMVGDYYSAIMCRFHYYTLAFWISAVDLSTSVKNFTLCMEEAVKYQQQPIVYMSMAYIKVCAFLSDVKTDAKILSLDELVEIGEKRLTFLLYQTFIYRLLLFFLVGDYMQVVKLSQWYETKDVNGPKNRSLNLFRFMFEGIACFHLARDTQELKWKAQGEKAMGFVSRIEPMCKSQFENKVQLLRAELHYLEGDLESATVSYEASIASARAQRFINEEAIALEHYGIFCVENQMLNKGIEQLRMALEQYEKWGARKKAKGMQQMIDQINRATAVVVKYDTKYHRTGLLK